jgi:hypothetical protein
MRKTYRGSCTCGAVRFEVDLDLALGTTRCNCSFCRKTRFWFAIAKGKEAFRMLDGTSALSDFQRTPPTKPQPYLHMHFCKHCGVRPFTTGGDGDFHAINVTCLDDVLDAELANAPIHFADGAHDDWKQDAPETFL